MRVAHLMLLAGLSAGCASVQEQRALQVWHYEKDQLQASTDVALDPQAGLAAYVRYAQLNNPGLKAAFARWRAALERVAPARTLADPRLTYGYFVRQVQTRVGPQQARFALAQTLPWVGKLDLKGCIALQKAEVDRQRYELARRVLVLRVKKAYYDYYYLQRSIAITEDNVQLLAYLEEVGHAHYRGGTGAHEAVLKAQVELGRLQDRLRGLRARRRPVTAKLNAALGRRVVAELAVPDSLPPVALASHETDWVARLKATHPALEMARARARQTALAVELAGKNGYPDLTLGIDYVQTGVAPGVADSGKDPLVAMVTINLPIWRTRYRAERRAAAASHRSALFASRDEEDRLVVELELVRYNWREAQSRTVLYRDSLLPKAEQALHVAQRAFAAGRSDFLAVIDAQRALLEFQLSHERARTDEGLYAAEIEHLVGSVLVGEGGGL
ncbi:MAG TPA: TolC family protein [Candidatus Handelsmanbacteria bacterium]|nr:TolC family protein [Candidatus Handelsmanbacteria bacterium]